MFFTKRVIEAFFTDPTLFKNLEAQHVSIPHNT